MTQVLTPSDLLRAQLDVARENLRRAGELVNSPEINDLAAGVRARFANLLAQRTEQLDKVDVLLRPPPQLGDAWRFLRKARNDNGHLLDECLAFVQGALARRAGVDGGLCRLADMVLQEISDRTDIPWRRLTIPADAEFTQLSTEIIRLHFSDVGIWRLPLMAHEFGHLAVGHLEVSSGGLVRRKPLLDFAVNSPASTVKLHEVCSDLFGVYVLGPAFACNAILLEFDPSSDDDEKADAKHPSDAKREYMIVKALRRLDDPANPFNTPFTSLATSLSEIWELERQAAGKKAVVPANTALLDTWVESVWMILSDNLPAARYGRDATAWMRTMSLADSMSGNGADGAASDPRTAIIDVLNAAWWARMGGGASASLDRRALAVAQTVAERRK